MGDEWRVRLIFVDHQAAKEILSHPAVICDQLRSYIGNGIAVSTGRGHISLYASTAHAAEEAGRMALDLLAQQGLGADSRLDSWDSTRQEWRDANDYPRPAEDDDEQAKPPRKRWGRATMDVIGAVIEGFFSS